jgi:hypothetical protein
MEATAFDEIDREMEKIAKIGEEGAEIENVSSRVQRHRS